MHFIDNKKINPRFDKSRELDRERSSFAKFCLIIYKMNVLNDSGLQVVCHNFWFVPRTPDQLTQLFPSTLDLETKKLNCYHWAMFPFSLPHLALASNCSSQTIEVNSHKNCTERQNKNTSIIVATNETRD